MTELTRKRMDLTFDQIALFASAVVLACLSSLYAVYRDQGDLAISRNVKLTAILGGFLGGVFAFALQINAYGWDRPWLAIAIAIPAGFGSPFLIAASTEMTVRFLKRLGSGNGRDEPR